MVSPLVEQHFWHSTDSAIAKYTLIRTQNENNEDTAWLNTCFRPMKPGFEIHQIFLVMFLKNFEFIGRDIMANMFSMEIF